MPREEPALHRAHPRERHRVLLDRGEEREVEEGRADPVDVLLVARDGERTRLVDELAEAPLAHAERLAAAEVDDAAVAAAAQRILERVERDARALATKVAHLDLALDPVEGEVEDRVLRVAALRPLLRVVVERVDRDDVAMDERDRERAATQEFEHRLDARGLADLGPVGLEAEDPARLGAGMDKRVVTELHDVFPSSA